MAHSILSVLNQTRERARETQGGLAQLVERLLCKQDVSGSSPLTSTNRGKIAELNTAQQLIYGRVKSLLDCIQYTNQENCIVRSQVEETTDTNVRRQSAWLRNQSQSGQATKGRWWIPRHTEAMKDVTTDDMLRGAGSKL
jgi:hypothetical protein